MARTKNPPRVWTDQERATVKRMAMIGIQHEMIAKCLKTRVQTLETEFREILDTSATEANQLVAGALFKSAMKGNIAAQIFWCKTRLGWRERYDHEVAGKDGGGIVVEVNINKKAQ